MNLAVVTTPVTKLPSVSWRWEPETDILSGNFRPAASGAAGALELTSADGSIVVLDLVGGRLNGLDVVIWPEVETVPKLRAPARQGAAAATLSSEVGEVPVLEALEAELILTAEAAPSEDVIHLMVGRKRPVRVVGVADNLLLEVDDSNCLAGFWLLKVPPLPEGEELG